jgi:hypothetical protein
MTRPMAPTPTIVPLHNLSFPTACHVPGSAPLHFSTVLWLYPFPFRASTTGQPGCLRALDNWNTRFLSRSYVHPLNQHTGKHVPNNSLTEGELSTSLTTYFFKPKPPRIYRVIVIQGYRETTTPELTLRR